MSDRRADATRGQTGHGGGVDDRDRGGGSSPSLLARTVGARLAGALWDPPAGPVVALVVAVVVGTAATFAAARRLDRRA
jgi:hypothetical protein